MSNTHLGVTATFDPCPRSLARPWHERPLRAQKRRRGAVRPERWPWASETLRSKLSCSKGKDLPEKANRPGKHLIRRPLRPRKRDPHISAKSITPQGKVPKAVRKPPISENRDVQGKLRQAPKAAPSQAQRGRFRPLALGLRRGSMAQTQREEGRAL